MKHIRFLVPGVVLAVLQGLPGPLYAHVNTRELLDLPLEQLLEMEVLSTPKFASNPMQVPSAVDVLTEAEIRAYGWQTISDALRSLRGFNVTNDYSYTYAGGRGIVGHGDFRPRMLVLINGLRINENIYDSADLNQAFPLDISQVRRIEAIRGPGASVFGGNAMFGVINIITRNGADLQGGEVQLTLRSGRDRRAVLNWGDKTGARDLRVSLSVQDSSGRTGYFDEFAAAGLPAEADGVDAGRSLKFSAQYSAGGLRASLMHVEHDKFIPTGSYGTILGDLNHRESDTKSLLELGYRHELGSNSYLDNRVYGGVYRFEGIYPYDYEPDYVLNFDAVDGRWWGLESRLQYQLSERHTLNSGIEFKRDYKLDQLNGDLGLGCVDNEQSEFCLVSRYQREQIALYLQDEIRLGFNTRLVLGLRHDNFSDQQDHTVPRLGLVHEQASAGLFKYLYTEGFRNPNAYERFYDPVPWGFANPALVAETLQSHEFTWEKSLFGQDRLSTTLYWQEVCNWIGADADGISQNMPFIKARGLELQYRREFSGGAQLRLDYTWAKAGSDQDSDLLLVPRHSLKLNAIVPTGIVGWQAGLEWQLQSERRTIFPAARIAGHGLLNLNLLHRAGDDRLEFSVGIRNLFDREYADPVAADIWAWPPRDRIRQLGRSVQANLVWRL